MFAGVSVADVFRADGESDGASSALHEGAGKHLGPF